MKCSKRLMSVIFLVSFLTATMGFGNAFAQVTETPAKWSYAAFGIGIGDRGIIADTVGGSREIYLESHAFDYWYALYYDDSNSTYEQGFVSASLGVDTFDDIIALRLGNVTGDAGKEIVVAMRKGNVYIYNQATKNLIKVVSLPIGFREWAKDFEIADVDNDGQNEFIMGSDEGLYVYSSSGTLEWDMDIETRDIVVGQMDNDSGLEIAAAPENYYTDNGYVIDCSSRSIQWTHSTGFGSGYYFCELTAVDIDNDNRDELVVMEDWYKVQAYDVEQKLLKWSITTSWENGAICVTDVDNDSVMELLLGQNQYRSLTAYDTVTLDQEWSFENPAYSCTGIEVADVDGDGNKEMMWGTGYSSGRQDIFFVANWQSSQVEWQSSHLGGPFIGPECGDLDGDGNEELAVLAYDTRPGMDCARIQVFDTNGNLRGMSQPIMNDELWVGVSRIKLYDVDQDGKLEILVTGAYIYDAGIEIYDFNADNTFDLIWTNSTRPYGAYFNCVTAGDIDNDGQLEIIGGVGKEHTGCLGLFVYVYDFNTGDEEWHSLQHGTLWNAITYLEVGDLDNDGDQEIISVLDGEAVYIFNGRTKELDTIIFGSYTALTLINSNQTPPSILLGDEAGNIEMLTYSGGSYQTDFKKDYSSNAIDGISNLSTSEEFIFGTDGTLKIADSNGVIWSSAKYGPVYGRWAAKPNGSPYIFSAGSYSFNSFDYLQLPFITVVRPNGGEEWTRGTSQTIYWTSTGIAGNVKIEYSTDNGSSWSTITSSTFNSGSYVWTVPDTVSSQCLVQVSEVGGSLSDTSNAVFSITAVPATPPEIYLNRSQLNFSALVSGAATGEQTFSIANNGGGILEWTVSDTASWLNCTPVSGTGYGVITVSMDHGGLAAGNYTGFITVSDPDASNSPQTVTVNLTVKNASESQQPFGEFATPQDGAAVSSSIPVTGWVLDDLEVVSVKIYNGSSFVGDAIFVEGARPDVEQAYPGYPNNHKAGWGYMLLSNFLPDGGNGTYTLYSKAIDKEGNEVTLGSKTIIVDNANAVKPFGAVDTPTQGGSASGSSFANWGWVLTPQPNKIPTDGSTIKVWIDGVEVGNPTYNINRSDIAGKFPDYANSDGAGGYFYLDTTAYANGVHTIQWTAEDNAGNSEGIDSRYFTIENMGADASNVSNNYSKNYSSLNRQHPENNFDITAIPVDRSNPVKIKKDWGSGMETQPVYPSENGVITIEIKELERLELHLAPRTYNGSALPVGSHLDIERGVFYWQPGPGFVGCYSLDFVQEEASGLLTRKTLLINIIPKY